ncbi:hypothetical protein M1373_00595 [Candidatus Marsarchaeota archaeon]|nr:hypothetical protein [Candidatus Marsarchaeota archaeon]MCL5404742.1 hypothetical protein [Candidatus Marsarchaeota archaeon]
MQDLGDTIDYFDGMLSKSAARNVKAWLEDKYGKSLAWPVINADAVRGLFDLGRDNALAAKYICKFYLGSVSIEDSIYAINEEVDGIKFNNRKPKAIMFIGRKEQIPIILYKKQSARLKLLKCRTQAIVRISNISIDLRHFVIECTKETEIECMPELQGNASSEKH